MAEEINMTVTVKRVIYRDQISGYTIASVDIKHSSAEVPTTEPVMLGYFPMLLEDDHFTVYGKWVKHPQYGFQFAVDRSMRVFPATLQGQKALLAKAITGVGPKKSEMIVKKFGTKTLEIIKDNWEKLMEVPGVGKNLAKHIHDQVVRMSDFDAVAMFLLGIGISYKTAIKIYDLWGSDTIQKVKTNPYSLCEISGIGFLRADKFALNLGIKLDSPFRIEAGLIYAMEQLRDQQGHIYYPRAPLIGIASKILSTNEFTINGEEINKTIDRLIAKGVLVQEDEKIYLQEMYNTELAVAQKLRKLMQAVPVNIYKPELIDRAIVKFEKENKLTLDDKQKQAIRMALTSGFSILTGGPGTGKTMTVNAIIQCLTYIEPKSDIRLAAPTGKAAKRMSEMTGRPASTIHRLLNLKRGKEVQNNQLAVDFLILDESSMIELWLANQLFKAVAPGTRVLFVGDVDQLPPVGAGSVFKDLIESGQIPVTRLTTIFRQAQESQIVMNAHAIIQNNPKAVTFDRSKGDFYFINCQDKQKTANFIIQSVERLLATGFSMADIQILSPIRKGDLGINVINEMIQRRFNPFKGKENEVKYGMQVFRVGDKVMQTKNDYDLEVFNGEVGIIKAVRYIQGANGTTDVTVEIDFEDRVVKYDYEALENLVLAYAITCHKSQGSEYKAIIMPVHNTHMYFLHRNLIYTAITRAKQKVILIGTKKAFYIGIHKKDHNERYSSLAQRLKEINIPSVKQAKGA